IVGNLSAQQNHLVDFRVPSGFVQALAGGHYEVVAGAALADDHLFTGTVGNIGGDRQGGEQTCDYERLHFAFSIFSTTSNFGPRPPLSRVPATVTFCPRNGRTFATDVYTIGITFSPTTSTGTAPALMQSCISFRSAGVSAARFTP